MLEWIRALAQLVSSISWPFVVVWSLWYFGGEIRSILNRFADLSGFKAAIGPMSIELTNSSREIEALKVQVAKLKLTERDAAAIKLALDQLASANNAALGTLSSIGLTPASAGLSIGSRSPTITVSG
jgi:hypothetical protein